MVKTLHPAVTAYLEQLERAVKQKIGVVPEEILCDAREHLQHDIEALNVCEPGLSTEQVHHHFITTYGDPHDVAAHYEDFAQPLLRAGKGYAPGWRISCTSCGRSVPAARAGIVRVGAASVHKYVLGWCADCHWLRWMRLEKDLERTNLTRALGAEKDSDTMRRQRHHPWL
ncbi:MAG: hypothetical protein KDA60_15715, partial [Planctomycetales bacterium]|nr:hypothetical protein [Planctomycetales bacterium]